MMNRFPPLLDNPSSGLGGKKIYIQMSTFLGDSDHLSPAPALPRTPNAHVNIPYENIFIHKMKL
jgi:hypothetical protein